MPCYLFTYHAYRSWMPDRRKGYVRRGQGILPTNREVAVLYANNAAEELATFLAEHQLAAIATIREAVTHIDCRLHYVSTDSTHIHPLVSWDGPRTWQQNRNSLKRAITIGLKKQFEKRTWLSEGASRKRVRDQAHFDYSRSKYLPKHAGWRWCEGRGLYR